MTLSESEKIWSGDESVVAVAKDRYFADPHSGLIPYAVVLYSFRHVTECHRSLLWLRAVLMERGEELWKSTQRGDRSLENANLCDVLSTHLQWMTRQGTLNSDERDKTLRTVKKLCLAGMECVSDKKKGAHTMALLNLTVARVCLREKKEAWGALYIVENVVVNITDPLQRARVCAKLGYLYRKNWQFLKGYYWGVRALCMHDIPRNVRLKSLALLAGYDR